VSCSPVTVPKGAASTCTATPDPGYQVASWGDDCAGAGASSQCYLPKVQKDQTASVRFAATTLATVHVTALVDGGNGTVSCAPSDLPRGGGSTCTAVPDAGYHVAHWDGACLLSGINPHCTLTNVQSDLNSTVSFTAQPAGIFNVSARVNGGNGAVSCAPARLSAGGSSACTAVPDAGYQVAAWSGACAFAGSADVCRLTNIQADKASAVSFVAAPLTTTAVPTLSEWGLILLCLLMLGLGWSRLRALERRGYRR